MGAFTLADLTDSPPKQGAFSLDDLDDNSPAKTSTQEASAFLERSGRPQSPAPASPSSARLSLGPSPTAPRSTARSTAEGLVTEQQERRGGMPLIILPPSTGLEAPRPSGITPVPSPTSRLAPVQGDVQTPQDIREQNPNALFTPQEERERHAAKVRNNPDAGNTLLQNYQKNLELGRMLGQRGAGGFVVMATGKDEELPAVGQPGIFSEEYQKQYGAKHPAAMGVARAAGGVVGQMAADPVTYLFAGTSEVAEPLLSRIISTGFRTGLTVHAIKAAADLKNNWSNYSPEERYEKAADAGISGVMAAGAHQIRDSLKAPYEALPAESGARAESLFRNQTYRAGAEALPKNPTFEQANKAFRRAAANIHADTGSTSSAEFAELTDTWNRYKDARGWGKSGPTPNPMPDDSAAKFWAPKTLGGQVEAPPVTPPQPPPADPATQALLKNAGDQQAATRMSQGLSPTPPPPPPPKVSESPLAPPSVKQGRLAPEDVEKFATAIQPLPPELRAKAVQEAHQTLSKVLLEQGQKGPVVLPDGTLALIKSPEDAERTALTVINKAVTEKEKSLAQPEGEGEKGAAVASPPAAAPTKPGPSRAKAQALAEPKGKFSVEDLTEGVESSNGTGINQGNNDRGGESVPRVAPVAGTAEAGMSDRTIPAAPADGELSASKEAVPPNVERGAEPATEPKPLAKGDIVSLKSDTDVHGETFPAGTKVSLTYLHPNGLVVRGVVTDGPLKGRKIERRTSAFQSQSGEASGRGIQSEAKPRASVPFAQTSQPSTAVTPSKPFALTDHEKEVAQPYGPPKVDHGGEVAPENLGFNHTIETGPDIGQKTRTETERRMGGPLPRGQGERRIAEVAKPESSGGKALASKTEEAVSPRPEVGKPESLVKEENQKVGAAATGEASKGQFSARDLTESAPREVAPGKVGEMKVSDLRVAPHRFQYKLSTDAEGVSTLLKDTKKFDPDLAGTISVWKDPADGKFYVINGHHRYELAKRTGTKTIAVRHIVAADAAEARAVGARQNIAEGRGTPIDAAKFFRETNITPEDLEKHGISLGEATASKGLALSNLDDSLFNKVVQGDLSQGRAVAIGEATKDHAEQKAILSMVEKKERSGAKVSDATLSELIRLVKGAEKTTETTADLFGSQQITRSLALEKAEISAHIKQQIAKDKKLFGFVAKADRAVELERGGNKIDVDKSKEISTSAAQAEEVYNKLSSRGGPIASILDEAARRLADGESAGAVKSEAYQRVRAEVSKTLGGSQGEVPQGLARGTEAEKGIDLFSGAEPAKAPTFYSKAEKIAEQKVSTGTGASVLATLKNGGVKEDEIKWLGLDDFLKDKPRVTKAELQQHIRENSLQIQEVSRSDRAIIGTPTAEALDPEIRRLSHWPEAPHIARDPANQAQLDFLNEEWERRNAQEHEPRLPTKYSSYTLPGDKKNYTELLLQLPSDPAGGNPYARIVALEDKLAGAESERTKYLQTLRPVPGDVELRFHDAQTALRKARNELAQLKPFQSSHFDEPNIVAHVRFDGRTDADGKKVLLVEEVQSDWHQKGKKIGYDNRNLSTERQQAEKRLKEIADKYPGQDGWVSETNQRRLEGMSSMEPVKMWRYTMTSRDTSKAFPFEHLGKDAQIEYHPYRKQYILNAAHGHVSNAHYATLEEAKARAAQEGIKPHDDRPPEIAEEAKKLAEKLLEIKQLEMNPHMRGVPDAPFKTDWHELAMKRMLRAAAENGFDKLAWVTGEQTADRYDLAKHVDEIRAARAADNNKFSITGYKLNSAIFKKFDVDEKDLPDFVGKDLATKIATLEPGKHGNYSGLDLKTGGTWAKALYDRAIPNFINKVGKKWGVKVAESVIPTTENWDHEPSTYEGPNRSLREVEQLHELSHANGSVRESPFTGRRQTFVINRVDVSGPVEEIRRQMRGGASFAGAMERSGTPELAEIFGGELKQGAVKNKKDTVHSIDVTPEMKKSVMEEGQPLFRQETRPITAGVARGIDYKIVPTKPGLPPYIRVNPHAVAAISNSLGTNFLGVNLDKPSTVKVIKDLRFASENADKMGIHDAAMKLSGFADALEWALDESPKEGVSLVREGEGELETAHEELLHAMQRRAGGGDIGSGVPWKAALRDHVIAGMAADLADEFMHHGIAPDPAALVAEAMVDLLRGDATHLTVEGVTQAADHYFESAAQLHGIQHLEDLQAVQDYIAGREEALNVTHDKQVLAIRRAGEEALARAIARGTGSETGSTGKALPGESIEKSGTANPATGAADSGPPNDTGLGRKRPASATEKPAFSTAPIGLTDDELAEWSKSKGFRYEPAGEQLGMFGDNDPLLRVFRQGPRGREQRGLIYQNQLDRLQEAKPESNEPFALTGGEAREEQPALFGAGDLGEIVGNPKAENGIKLPSRGDSGTSLFRKPESLITGESGEAKPGELAKTAVQAAATVGNYVREVAHATKIARNLQRGLETLDTAAQADILRAKDTFEDLKKQGLSRDNDEALYHHLEDPEGIKLSTKEDDFLDDVALPIAEQNTELYKELVDGGVPIENYVSRSVKGKGGMLDRIAAGAKAVAKKGTLSKAAPQTKTRTMMAIESPSGERRVISIKDGKATMWKDGESSDLGEIKNAAGKSDTENETWPDGEPNSVFFDKGKIVEGPDGYDWKITQATTKEIEANTDLKYFKSAFASLLSSNIQLGRAVRAMRFLEAFKASPEFKEISWQGNGSPPDKWKPSVLPQFKGVYFEPRTAETLDDYAERLKGGDFGVMQTIQSFLRAAYLINPVVHPLNVATSWAMEKGVSGFMPWKWKKIYRSGSKAVLAVLKQNDDFKAALYAGGALQSHRAAIQDMHKLFFERIAEGLDKEEPWALKLAKSLGIEKGNLLNLLHKPSSIAAWVSSDVMYLQAAYQYQEEHPGTPLKDAIKEVGRIIPEYRVPSRIMDSRLLSKAMTNPLISWFGSYHYGLLNAFGQSAKDALGMGGGGEGNKPPSGGSQGAAEGESGPSRGERARKGWDRIAMLGLITMALYPYVFDPLARKLTGDKHARAIRRGPAGYVDAAQQVAEGKQSAGAAAQKVFTPSPLTKTGTELLFDKQLFSGREIYDPHASWPVQTEQIGRYLLHDLGQYGQYAGSETSAQKHKFWWQQAGVSFGETRAEKMAQDIAIGKAGTAAEDPDDEKSRVMRREILDQLRQGNRKPLEEAEAKKQLTHKQITLIQHRAKLDPLEDTMYNFSVKEAEKVLEAAKADKDKQEIKLVQRIVDQKKLRAHSWATPVQ